VSISTGIFSLTLTASEMDNNKIDVIANYNTTRNVAVSIFTSKKNNDKIKNSIIPFI